MISQWPAGKIKRFRTRYLGISQWEFAVHLGTTANTVARWERGESSARPMWRKKLDAWAKQGSFEDTAEEQEADAR